MRIAKILITCIVASVLAGCSSVGDWAKALAYDEAQKVASELKSELRSELQEDVLAALDEAEKDGKVTKEEVTEVVKVALKESASDALLKFQANLLEGMSVSDAAKDAGKEGGIDLAQILGYIVAGSISAYAGKKVGQSGERKRIKEDKV